MAGFSFFHTGRPAWGTWLIPRGGGLFFFAEFPNALAKAQKADKPLPSTARSMMAGWVFLVLTGACQFGHGVGGFTTNSIHSKSGQTRGFPRVFSCFAEQNWQTPVRRLSTLNSDFWVLEPQNLIAHPRSKGAARSAAPARVGRLSI